MDTLQIGQSRSVRNDNDIRRKNCSKEVAMDAATVWWVLAGVCVAVELAIGTFYLLMVALGFASAAVATHLGAPVPVQLVVAGVVGAASVLVLRQWRNRQAPALQANANPNVNLDVGETVQVTEWPQQTPTVRYRGSTWSIAPAPGYHTPEPGPHRIVQINGSQLVLQKA
jgi:membrane protein implicated in regulation of membrane protease activity